MAEQGRVRWKRFGLTLVPVSAMTSLLIGATTQGVIGATFVVPGNSFKLFAGELRGQGFTLASDVDRTRKGRLIPVIVAGVRRAAITELCSSALVKTPVGTITIRLTGGRGGNEVIIDDLVIDVAVGQTVASIRDLELGRDASTLEEVPGGRAGRHLRRPGQSGHLAQRQAGRVGRHGRDVQPARSSASTWCVVSASATEADLARPLGRQAGMARDEGRKIMKSWRRSRPFWGGLFIVAAGLELLSIPLAIDALPVAIMFGTVGAGVSDRPGHDDRGDTSSGRSPASGCSLG